MAVVIFDAIVIVTYTVGTMIAGSKILMKLMAR